MKWASFALGVGLLGLILWALVGAEVASVRPARASIKASAPSLAFRTRPEPIAVAPGEADPKRIVQPGRVVSVPTGCVAVAGSYDLMLHFHGAPAVLESALERSGMDSALAIVNLGIGSGVYEQAFSAPGSFLAFVAEVTQTLKKLCPQAQAPRRIALSAWSAGYGAIWRIMEQRGYDNLVDAVLLADGLHAGFVGPKHQRNPDALKLEPFSLFAELAKHGKKMFAITHSAIQTLDYASTTETSQYLLERAGLEATAGNAPGPRPEMRLTSQADFGAFHVLGFSGNDKQAHADQLHAFGDTLLPYLRERWRK